MRVLEAGLAAFMAVSAVRFLLEIYVQRDLQAGTKVVLAIIAGAGFSALNFHGWQPLVLESLASAGLATLLHRFHRVLGAIGDSNRADLLRRR